MGRIDSHAFASLVQRLSAQESVAHCLPYPGMTPIPDGFDAFARQDAASAEMEWGDACPAYALGLITYGSYALPRDEEYLEVLWDELGGDSTQVWAQARPLVLATWAWLSNPPAQGPSPVASNNASDPTRQVH